jgi:protein-tyrosine phosphatase
LRDAGFKAILSLNDGEGCDREEFATLRLDHWCVPLPPWEPPESGDEDLCHAALSLAYDFVKVEHQRDHPVLVHCSAGKDRTGLFMALFLMREYGVGIEEPITRVRAVQPRAMTAAGWEALSRRVLTRLREGGW